MPEKRTPDVVPLHREIGGIGELRFPSWLFRGTEKLLDELIGGGGDADGFAEEGVLILEFDGAEGHGWVAKDAVVGGAVHGVAKDGEAGVLEVEADLVGAAGDGAGFDEGEIVFSFEHCEVGFGVF